jgi:hypothetical protein
MISDRTKAQGLALALKAVLNVAKKRGLDLDELTEAAAEELLQYRSYDSEFVPMAIQEIGVAVDALQV